MLENDNYSYMIPKIIHYCWFGGKEKPKSVLKYIDNWKRMLPDYQIIEWNESNFEISNYIYAQQAYERKKFAFVSDVARLKALYDYGGIYLDTDVEVLKSFDSFLNNIAFCGYESYNYVSTAVLGCVKESNWAKTALEEYKSRSFINEDNSVDTTTNVEAITKMLVKYGFTSNNSFQIIDNMITIYPSDFFSPKSYSDGIIRCTKNSVTIHHFACSWYSTSDKIKRYIHRILGDKLFYKMMSYKNNK